MREETVITRNKGVTNKEDEKIECQTCSIETIRMNTADHFG